MISSDIAAWRTQLRKSLLERRLAIPAESLQDFRRRIDTYLQRAFPDLVHGAIGFCWPYRNEYDARHLLAQLRRQGAITALPVVLAPKAPLQFREWHPGVTMRKGVLGIPFPVGTAAVQPDTFLIPVVAFDGGGYRLGYGGAYFDRTLAGLDRPARKIGLGYEILFVETIHPQPHDVPMDYVVTERGVYERREGGLEFLGAPREGGPASGYSSPACEAHLIAPGYFGDPER